MSLLVPHRHRTHDMETEALIKEARRLRRRRWLQGTGLVLAAAVLAGVVFAVASGRRTSTGKATPAESPGRPYADARAFSDHGELAFVSHHVLWVLDGSNGSLHEVTKRDAISPVFSPDGRWLAYVTTAPSTRLTTPVRPEPGQLWIARADGTDPRAVPGLTNAQDPSWSPAADVLAVRGGVPGGVWLVTPPGTTSRMIRGTGHAESFVWSPGGTEIAFSGYGQYGNLQTVPISGGAPVVWQEELNDRAYPHSFNTTIPARWLPDGEGILYWIDQGASASLLETGLPLYLVRHPDGTGRLLGRTLVTTSAIATSRTGAFAIVGDTGGRTFWRGETVERCSAKTASCTKVPAPPGDVTIYPSWSPDGRLLVYSEGPARTSHKTSGFFQPALTKWYSGLTLRTITTSQSSSVGLQGTAGATGSIWSANGKSILYQAKNGLWLLATLRARPVEVAAPLFEGQWPDFYAEVDWSGQFAWSVR